MKKAIIIFIILSLFGVIACEDFSTEIFNELVRDNPNDPAYDKENDPNNKPELPPVAPGNLRGIRNNFDSTQEVIVLNWQDNSDYEDGYYLYRSPATSDDFIKLDIVIDANKTRYDDKTIKAGSSYKYIIKGFNKNGEGPASNVAKVLIGAPTVKIEALSEVTKDYPVFIIEFTSNVENFGDDNDLEIENGTIDSLENVFGNTWKLTVEPIEDGPVAVTVVDGAASSPSSGFGNFESERVETIYDTTPPSISLELNDEGGYWNETEITGRVVFSDTGSDVHKYYKMDSWITAEPEDEDWILVGDTDKPLKSGENTSFNLNTNGQPSQTVKIMVKDLAGNTNEVEATTIMDTTSPVAANITTFDLYDTDTGYQGKTNDDTFSARIVASAAGGAPITKIYIHDTYNVDESSFGWITVGSYNNTTEEWEAEVGWEYSDNGQTISGDYHGILTVPDNYGNNYYIWIQDAVNNSLYDSSKDYNGAKRAAIVPDTTAPGVQSVTTDDQSPDAIFTIDFDDIMGTDFTEAEVYFYSLPTDVTFPTAENPMNSRNCSFSLHPTDSTMVIIDISGGIAPNAFEEGEYSILYLKGIKDVVGNYCGDEENHILTRPLFNVIIDDGIE